MSRLIKKDISNKYEAFLKKDKAEMLVADAILAKSTKIDPLKVELKEYQEDIVWAKRVCDVYGLDSPRNLSKVRKSLNYLYFLYNTKPL